MTLVQNSTKILEERNEVAQKVEIVRDERIGIEVHYVVF